MSKNRVDQYPLTHIDCVKKAISYMLGEFDENFPSVYLMYTNYIRCYRFEEVGMEMDILEYLCEENILPLDFRTEEVTGEVHSVVEKMVENGKVCLVPGNLNELFYSKYYHISNWPHLFYVNGCRKEEQLFKILDSVQKTENEQVFSKFVMEYEKLNKVYTSYCYTYKENMMYSKENVIYYFERKRVDEGIEVDLFKIVKNILSELIHMRIGKLERQMLENIKTLHGNNEEKQNKYNDSIKDYLGNEKIKFSRNIKKKEVFFSELISNIEMYLEIHKFCELKNALEELIKSWNSYYRIMIASVLRGDTIELEKKLENLIEKESTYILDLYKSVSCYSTYEKKDLHSNIWKVENSVDEMVFDEKTISVKIKEEHNAWIEDNSIKAMLKEDVKDKEKWTLNTHVCVEGAYKDTNYHVGIVFRSIDDKMYFWGSYNQECIRLSNIGIKVDEIDIIPEDDMIQFDIGIIKDKESVKLYYNTQKSGSRYVDISKQCIGIREIGLVCKTWESEFKESLDVTFSNINYNV